MIAGLLAQSARGERTANQSADRAAPDPQLDASERDGIRWFEGTVDEAFAAAKQQRKPVFKDYVTVHGVPRNDVLNVRSGPSAQSRIVGALANGDRVRNLGCRNAGGSRWCRIQMLDDMKSEGWVNDRYLKESGAPSDSGGNIDHGGRIENNCAAAVAREVGVSANDVMVTNSTISEGTGRHVVYVGVPYGKADWICEADRNGRVVNVFYSGE